ncbi:MAG TPA: hypothetical protein ACHBZ9_21180 [Arsenophonus nasoniae]|uniref:hypothetical protein n=1 Tax=Arsenophonus nasoniae TaxID=638 RepID=UPI003879E8C1
MSIFGLPITSSAERQKIKALAWEDWKNCSPSLVAFSVFKIMKWWIAFNLLLFASFGFLLIFAETFFYVPENGITVPLSTLRQSTLSVEWSPIMLFGIIFFACIEYMNDCHHAVKWGLPSMKDYRFETAPLAIRKRLSKRSKGQ